MVVGLAWYSDEEFVLRNDNRDRAITARSARKQRSHCGKSGSVRLPHETLTKGQLKKMSGEVKDYNLARPITWNKFKSMPDDLKVEYITKLRERFAVPDRMIAMMLGVSSPTFSGYIKCLNLPKVIKRGTDTWDREGFEAWVSGETVKDLKDGIDIPAVNVEEQGCNEREAAAYKTIIPFAGTLRFKRDNIDDILTAIKMMLQDSSYVDAIFIWNIDEAKGVTCNALEEI